MLKGCHVYTNTFIYAITVDVERVSLKIREGCMGVFGRRNTVIKIQSQKEANKQSSTPHVSFLKMVIAPHSNNLQGT